jgi:hypothetical protein
MDITVKVVTGSPGAVEGGLSEAVDAEVRAGPFSLFLRLVAGQQILDGTWTPPAVTPDPINRHVPML